MANQPVARMPAAPSSPSQRERYQRILHAAAMLGTRTEFERVQMQDVAVEAGVAIATLYRYFPSKVHLFVAILNAEVSRAGRVGVPTDPGPEAVATMLLEYGESMLRYRTLSLSLMQSVNLAQSVPGVDLTFMEDRFREIVLRAAGATDPTDEDRRRAWLVVQCWFGVLMMMLNGHRSVEESTRDIHLACELLLAPGDRG